VYGFRPLAIGRWLLAINGWREACRPHRPAPG